MGAGYRYCSCLSCFEIIVGVAGDFCDECARADCEDSAPDCCVSRCECGSADECPCEEIVGDNRSGQKSTLQDDG